jgi:hypothetical protein
MKKILTASVFCGALFADFQINAQDLPKPDAPPISEADKQPDPKSLPVAAADPLFAPVVTFKRTSSREKFMDYKLAALSPKVLVAPGLAATIRILHPLDTYPKEWRNGPEAFARNYGNVLASSTSLKTARYLTGALLHEDFRYRPSTSKNPLARSIHALAFTFVDKSDSGGNRIALANFAAAGAGGVVGSLYLPGKYGNLNHAEARAAIAFGGIAGQNLRHEFAPDLLRLRRRMHLPFLPKN